MDSNLIKSPHKKQKDTAEASTSQRSAEGQGLLSSSDENDFCFESFKQEKRIEGLKKLGSIVLVGRSQTNSATKKPKNDQKNAQNQDFNTELLLKKKVSAQSAKADKNLDERANDAGEAAEGIENFDIEWITSSGGPESDDEFQVIEEDPEASKPQNKDIEGEVVGWKLVSPLRRKKVSLEAEIGQKSKIRKKANLNSLMMTNFVRLAPEDLGGVYGKDLGVQSTEESDPSLSSNEKPKGDNQGSRVSEEGESGQEASLKGPSSENELKQGLRTNQFLIL